MVFMYGYTSFIHQCNGRRRTSPYLILGPCLTPFTPILLLYIIYYFMLYEYDNLQFYAIKKDKEKFLHIFLCAKEERG